MKVKHFKLLEYTDVKQLDIYNYTIPQLKKYMPISSSTSRRK